MKHGTSAEYFRGCRCQPCRDAGSLYFARRRAGLCTRCGLAGHVAKGCRNIVVPERPNLVQLFARMKPQHPHAHRFRFDEPNGPLTRGVCQECGRVKVRPTSSYGRAFDARQFAL